MRQGVRSTSLVWTNAYHPEDLGVDLGELKVKFVELPRRGELITLSVQTGAGTLVLALVVDQVMHHVVPETEKVDAAHHVDVVVRLVGEPLS